MSIKSILGYCSCKGCKKKSVYDIDFDAIKRNGKKKHIKARICEEHIKELIRNSKINSVTYQQTVDFGD